MDWKLDDDFTAKLIVDVPMLDKGDRYYFEMESGHVYRHHPTKKGELIGPLRPGLAGYLWLLSTSGKWMRRAKG